MVIVDRKHASEGREKKPHKKFCSGQWGQSNSAEPMTAAQPANKYKNGNSAKKKKMT
jgi:hypothetical protein